MNRIRRSSRVLIAHQSTIPPYRIPFYEAVERQRPDGWDFTVIYDPKESRRFGFLVLDLGSFNFNVRGTNSYSLRVGSKSVSFQTFVLNARNYDLIIVENVVNNLSYPLALIYRLLGKYVAYWGSGWDHTTHQRNSLKKATEAIKLWLVHHADGFFAYTEGVKAYMTSHGLHEDRIFTLYNTIDVKAQRRIFDRLSGQRVDLQDKVRVEARKVLLYVGRLDRRKRLDFLAEAFGFLYEQDQSYRLAVIGGGDLSFIHDLKTKYGEDTVAYHGVLMDQEQMGLIYVESDLYVLPGAVGLAPLQALCFNLVPALIDSNFHGPEFEYLNESNALILPQGTSPRQYATAIDALLTNEKQLKRLRLQAWPSIQHLTIENMASRFIEGVDQILASGSR